MTPELVSKEKNTVKFTMTFTAEEFDAATQRAYLANRSKIQIDGFRKGKAPRSIIEKRYGEGVFFEDALDDLFATAYPESLDKLSIDPVSRPELEFGEEKLEKGKGFTVTVKVDVVPEVSVKDYKGIKVERPIRKVTDEDVQRELEYKQKANSRLVSVDRAAENGDSVILDYSGSIDGVKFEGGTAENQTLKLGSGTFIPGFEDQLVGVSAGEEKDVVVTFPKEYHAADLAGKEAVFKCKVHEVKIEELPEINDEFAVDASEFDTLDEMKADIRAKLEASAKDASEYAAKNSVLDKLYEANPLDVPQAMIDAECDQMLQEFTQQISYSGFDLKTYCQYLGKTEDELKKDFVPEAEKRVKTRLLTEAVADAEKIEVSDEDFDKELADMAAQYKMEVEKLKEMFGAENSAMLRQDIKRRKAIDFLYENAEITDVEAKPPVAEAKSEEAAEEKPAEEKPAEEKAE